MNTPLKKSQLKYLRPAFGLLFWRGIKLGWHNLWRNKSLSLASILVIAVMVTIFNSLMAVNMITQNALNSLNQKIDVLVYLRDDISLYDATYFQEQLSNFPGVKQVEYISKEKALEAVSKTYPETAEFLKKFKLANPLPPSFSIITEKPEDHDAVLQMIDKSRFKEYLRPQNAVDSNADREVISSTARNLVNISSFVKQLVFWVIFVFVVGSALVVINAIQLTVYARKNEILIMRLVGATPAFIRLPFMVEGAAYAFFAVFLSAVMLFAAVQTLGVGEVFWREIMPGIGTVLFAEMGIVVLLNLMCSFVTVENYLKKHLTFS